MSPQSPSQPIGHPGIRGVVVRNRFVSARLDTRAVAICFALTIAILAIGCWSISVGDFPIPLGDVFATLFGGGSDDAEFIIRTLRLPRAITAVLVGASFGMSGAIFQSLARNPLGSPDIIGFNSGAAAGAVFVIIVLGGSSLLVSVGAILGGVVSAAIVYALAWQNGLRVYRLVLVGIGIGFSAAAIVDYLLTRGEIYDVQRAAVWLTGSLNARTWENVRTVGIGLAVLGPVAVVVQRWLDRLELGDDVAAGIGVPVARAKLVLVLNGVGLAALAVASAGPIAFVAFIAAPIARRLVNTPGAALVPAALVGALITVAADLLARRLFAPIEFPVGIATGVLGAPYLLWLLTRQTRTGAL